MWKCPKCGRTFANTNQDHYCGKVNSIDEYIAGQPAEIQPLLQAVRETIRAAAPDAQERMSWQMPTFWQGENLIHFAAIKKHLGIYPGDLSLAPFEDRLAGYKRSKGAVQFPYGTPIDHALIADITRWRTEQAKHGTKTRAEPVVREKHPVPGFVADALTQSGLWERYHARPPYQQNDYIGWIARAKREETQQKRLSQMLEELRSGDAYMGMAYTAKG